MFSLQQTSTHTKALTNTAGSEQGSASLSVRQSQSTIEMLAIKSLEHLSFYEGDTSDGAKNCNETESHCCGFSETSCVLLTLP